MPDFDELVDVLRLRLAAADALNPSELHDVRELMSDYAEKVGDNWSEEAFDELEALGHLASESGKAMGGQRCPADCLPTVEHIFTGRSNTRPTRTAPRPL